MDMEEIVCPCLNVSIQDIEDAINNGANSYDEIVETTEVTTVCGVCEDRVREVVEELQAYES